MNYQKWPVITEAVREAVVATLESGTLTGVNGPRRIELEGKWAEYCGTEYCLGTNGGTAALHCALFACGVGAGSRVLMPALSFSGTFQPVIALGATPVFVDIDPYTFNMDLDRAEYNLRSGKIDAVIAVHLHGNPMPASVLKDWRWRYGVHIIEDACQAHGAMSENKLVGTLGDIGCFSLNHTKHLPAGEGGLLVTDDYDLYRRAQAYRVFGETGANQPFRTYDTRYPGLNYLLTEIPAAMATIQLEDFLPATINTARTNARTCNEILRKYVQVPEDAQNGTHVYHKYRVVLPQNVHPRRILSLLKAEQPDFPCGRWQVLPMPLYSIFENKHPRHLYSSAVKVLERSITLFSETYPICAQSNAVATHVAASLLDVLQGLET